MGSALPVLRLTSRLLDYLFSARREYMRESLDKAASRRRIPRPSAQREYVYWSLDKAAARRRIPRPSAQREYVYWSLDKAASRRREFR